MCIAGTRTGPVLVLTGSSVLLKGSTDRSQWSSSSSIENGKPTTKVGRSVKPENCPWTSNYTELSCRFDYSSSDAMSIGGHTTSASSSAAMDTSSSGSMARVESSAHSSTLPCDPASTRSPLNSAAASAKAVERLLDHKPASGSSTDSSVEPVLESLRWERECSDEEKEKERIEIYKENRRKRYENALAERKAQLSLHTSNKVRYYC